jgi:hypothetical protein
MQRQRKRVKAQMEFALWHKIPYMSTGYYGFLYEAIVKQNKIFVRLATKFFRHEVF